MALPQTHWIRMLNPWVIHTFKLLSRCLINLLKVLILNKFHFFTLIENLPPAILKKLQVKWKLLSRVWLFVTPWTIQSMDSPGQNTGVGSLFLLQGIFPTWGSKLGLWETTGASIVLTWRQNFSATSQQLSVCVCVCLCVSLCVCVCVCVSVSVHVWSVKFLE